METIAALALACNVMQLISFSREVITLAKQAATSGSVDAGLADRASRLSELMISLDETLSQLPKPVPASHHGLRDVALKCRDASRDLRLELEKLAPSKGRGLNVMRTLGSSLKIAARKSRIEKLEKTMLHWQQVLDSGLMLHVW
jgi:hypothetical protein